MFVIIQNIKAQKHNLKIFGCWNNYKMLYYLNILTSKLINHFLYVTTRTWIEKQWKKLQNFLRRWYVCICAIKKLNLLAGIYILKQYINMFI